MNPKKRLHKITVTSNHYVALSIFVFVADKRKMVGRCLLFIEFIVNYIIVRMK